MGNTLRQRFACQLLNSGKYFVLWSFFVEKQRRKALSCRHFYRHVSGRHNVASRLHPPTVFPLFRYSLLFLLFFLPPPLLLLPPSVVCVTLLFFLSLAPFPSSPFIYWAHAWCEPHNGHIWAKRKAYGAVEPCKNMLSNMETCNYLSREWMYVWPTVFIPKYFR